MLCLVVSKPKAQQCTKFWDPMGIGPRTTKILTDATFIPSMTEKWFRSEQGYEDKQQPTNLLRLTK
jgi:hypothetical protein